MRRMPADRRSRWKRWLRIGLGWVFVLFGLVGLILPFLQGIVFLLLGLVLLAGEQAWARRLLDRLRQRFPRVAAAAHRAEERGRAIIRRITGWFRSSDR